MTELEQISKIIKNADAILIGASNGLSITEGLHLFADNAAFEKVFGDLKRKYGIRSIIQGMSARWPSEEEKWGYWSRLIHHYCGNYSGSTVMSELKTVVGDKDYFIVTSNGECHFEMAGFSPEKIYEVEGNWLTMQCAGACHDRIYPCFELAEEMAVKEKDGKVPSEMVPHCPKCGGSMQIHLELDSKFIPVIEGEQKFRNFLHKYNGKNLVVLELGIGKRNQLIKGPLMRLVACEPQAVYITINLGEVYIPENIKERSFGIDGDLAKVLHEFSKACRG